MRIEFTAEEAEVFRSLLHDYLPNLRREVAGTDAREFRRVLQKRQDLLERVLSELGEPVEGAV
jgi:hypothetical protein